MSTQPSIWRVPVILGFLTAIGLIAGLVGDDLWDTAAVLLIGVPTAVGAWYTFRPSRERRS